MVYGKPIEIDENPAIKMYNSTIKMTAVDQPLVDWKAFTFDRKKYTFQVYLNEPVTVIHGDVNKAGICHTLLHLSELQLFDAQPNETLQFFTDLQP